MTDLYSFPDDHVGRKSYVTVRGHSKSIPKYKTYMGNDRHYYLLPEFGGDMSGATSPGPYILPDKLAYVSPMDGSHISSRSTHRDHMRRHGVVEAGDMKPGRTPNIDRAPMQRAGVDIVRSMQELRNR